MEKNKNSSNSILVLALSPRDGGSVWLAIESLPTHSPLSHLSRPSRNIDGRSNEAFPFRKRRRWALLHWLLLAALALQCPCPGVSVPANTVKWRWRNRFTLLLRCTLFLHLFFYPHFISQCIFLHLFWSALSLVSIPLAIQSFITFIQYINFYTLDLINRISFSFSARNFTSFFFTRIIASASMFDFIFWRSREFLNVKNTKNDILN